MDTVADRCHLETALQVGVSGYSYRQVSSRDSSTCRGQRIQLQTGVIERQLYRQESADTVTDSRSQLIQLQTGVIKRQLYRQKSAGYSR